MHFDELIFSVAYNMTGDYNISKDVVQDIHLKFLEKPIAETITDKRNYIIRTTINHCLNLKKREQRLQYVGEWLPEPITTFGENTSQQSEFEVRNLLCYELAFLMEKLSPIERAVFVLREAFDFTHKEIAEAMNITTENARQLLSRARKKVANLKHNSVPDISAIEIAKNFISLMNQGDVEGLISLFNESILLIGDGGGKAPSIIKPILGREAVAKFFVKLGSNKMLFPTFSYTQILSQPAIIIELEGKVISIVILSLHEHKIAQIFSVINPDKLTPFQK